MKWFFSNQQYLIIIQHPKALKNCWFWNYVSFYLDNYLILLVESSDKMDAVHWKELLCDVYFIIC